MFRFLRAIGLDPIEWETAVSLTGVASPSIPQVLECAFGHAWAVVVLFSGDDLARAGTRFLKVDDLPSERQLTPQSRQNVLFEAGLAFGMNPSRTVLVTIGEIRPFSDIAGRHLIHISDQANARNTLKDRLVTSGCAVDVHGKVDWLSEGDFDAAISSPDFEDDSNVSTSTAGELTADIPMPLGNAGSLEITPVVEPKHHFLCLNLTNFTLEPMSDYSVEVINLQRWSSAQGGFLKNSEFKPMRLLMHDTLEPESPLLYYVAQPNRHHGFFLSGKLFDGGTQRFEVTTEGTYRAEIVFRVGVWQRNLNLYFEWIKARGLSVASDPEKKK